MPITDNIQEYEADLVEVYLKDFYISRIDMWLLNRELINRCVSEQSKLSMFCLSGQSNCIIQEKFWAIFGKNNWIYFDKIFNLSWSFDFSQNFKSLITFITWKVTVWKKGQSSPRKLDSRLDHLLAFFTSSFKYHVKCGIMMLMGRVKFEFL